MGNSIFISPVSGGGGSGSTVDTIKAGNATLVNGVNKTITFGSAFASTAYTFVVDGCTFTEVSRTAGQIVITPDGDGLFSWTATLIQS